VNGWLAAMLALASAGVSITAAVLALRMPSLRFRWLWAIGCLIGVGWLQTGWHSGPVYAGFGINLPSFGLSKPSASSEWWVRSSVPAFALLFLGLLLTGNLGMRPAAEADRP